MYEGWIRAALRRDAECWLVAAWRRVSIRRRRRQSHTLGTRPPPAQYSRFGDGDGSAFNAACRCFFRTIRFSSVPRWDNATGPGTRQGLRPTQIHDKTSERSTDDATQAANGGRKALRDRRAKGAGDVPQGDRRGQRQGDHCRLVGNKRETQCHDGIGVGHAAMAYMP